MRIKHIVEIPTVSPHAGALNTGVV